MERTRKKEAPDHFCVAGHTEDDMGNFGQGRIKAPSYPQKGRKGHMGISEDEITIIRNTRSRFFIYRQPLFQVPCSPSTEIIEWFSQRGIGMNINKKEQSRLILSPPLLPPQPPSPHPWGAGKLP